MENLSHSYTQNTGSKNLLIYKTDDIQDLVLDNKYLNLTSKKYLADLQILKSQDSYIIKSKKSNFEVSHILSKENLQYFISSLTSTFSESIESLKSTKTKIQLDQLQNAEHTLIKELSHLFLSVNSISKFSQKLFGHTVFKDFKTIHLFIHEKGSAHSTHIHITKENIQETQESISEFSTLFLSVRKSKNRSFGQSSLKASNFKIIGTCIAQEFTLLNHNLVFVYSKDDFLPQSDEDIENFQSIRGVLKILFEIHLNSEFNLEKIKIAKNTIATLLNFSGEDEAIVSRLENLTEDNYVNFDSIIENLKEKFFDHADINLVERIALLGELLNTLQHELSNPLFGLQLSSEILLTEKLDDDQKMFIRNINQSIKRSQSILSNFAGLYKKNVQQEKKNLLDVLNEVSTLTKSESRNVKKTIQLEKVSEEDCSIVTNPTWLAQIVFNLIINSTQALKDCGHVTPEIVITIRKGDSEFILSFHDNGPGISSEKLKYIFDPFFTTKEEGNGLGLAISKKLAVKLGGSLSFEETTAGAKFLLRLPI